MGEGKDKKAKSTGVHSTTVAFAFLDETPDLFFLPERNEFLIHKSHHYENMPYDDLFKRFWRFAVARWRGQHFPESKIKDALKQVQLATDNVITHEDDDCVAFTDGVLRLTDGAFMDASDDLKVTFSLPYSYKTDIAGATCPQWEKFLSQVLFTDKDCKTHDENLALLLQECFGYCLFGSTEAETAFFFVGDGANGKSVVAHQLISLIGTRLTSAMSIETLTTRAFSAANLVGKRLNLSGEEESKFVQSDKFKALVSGELISAERKFGDTFEFRPRCKFIFLSNAIPSFSGLNYGIIRRLKILPFYRQFAPDERDTGLKYRLAAEEMPGIIRWAIDGAKRLASNNFVFSQSASADDAMHEFEADSSSAVRFWRETYEASPPGGQFVCCYDIYVRYKVWCKANGKMPFASVPFFRDAKPAGFEKSAGREMCSIHMKRERVYFVTPRPDAESFEVSGYSPEDLPSFTGRYGSS